MQKMSGIAFLVAWAAAVSGSAAAEKLGPVGNPLVSNHPAQILKTVPLLEAALWLPPRSMAAADGQQQEGAKQPADQTGAGTSNSPTTPANAVAPGPEKKNGAKNHSPRVDLKDKDAAKEDPEKKDPGPGGQNNVQYCDSGNRVKLKRGEITVGCPKVWRSDRIFTMLDGMLRDVDSITINALQGLDPNDPNLAEIVRVVNDLQVSAKFDQAALVNNRLQLQQLQNAQQNNGVLIKRRQELVQRQLDVEKQELDMIAAGKATVDSQGKITSDDQDFKNLQNTDTVIKGQISDIDTQIKANSSLSAPGTTSTSVDEQPKTGTALGALPDDLKKTIQDLLRKPTFPASIRMDNVIELLHQRMAREFAVMYDDLSRLSEQYDLYLVEFDIGVIPHHGAQDRQALVRLSFTNHTVLAYELYPGGSAYNVMRGQDKTNRVGISGAAQTLFGLGVAASFKHERNELHSSLSQSMFVSGFGAGSHDFGWLLGPAPYENFVSPGTRIVHAMVLVPKETDAQGKKQTRTNVDFTVTACWPRRETRYQGFWTSHSQGCETEEHATQPMTISMALPKSPSNFTVQQLAYTPRELRETPGSDPKTDDQQTNTVFIQFEGTIDPNLTITAGNKIIQRVRDVRGRAMYGAKVDKPENLAGNLKEQTAVGASRFGFLENDVVAPDTWLQLNSHTVLLNISKSTAGTDVFPVITLAEPGLLGGELPALMGPKTTVRVGEWMFNLNDVADHRLPESAYLPLFTQRYGTGRIKVYVDSMDSNKEYPTQLRINSETHYQGRSSPIWLHDQAQVVLVPEGTEDDSKFWALKCYGDHGTLSCRIPAPDIRGVYKHNFPTRFKVWVDEPPYSGRPGLWADDDLIQTGTSDGPKWDAQPYPAGEWGNVREVLSADGTPDHWEARIRLRNLSPAGKFVPELQDSRKKLGDLVKGRPARIDTGKLSLASIPAAQAQSDAWKSDALKLSQKPEPIGIEFGPDSLTLTIPFPALPLLAQTLHVDNTPAKGPAVELFTLPELLPKLLPGPVKITNLKDGGYRLEGEHLRAVQQVRLEKIGGKAVLYNVTPGLNNVDFFLTADELKENASYNVFVVIGTMTVPVMQEGDDKKLHQVRVPI